MALLGVDRRRLASSGLDGDGRGLELHPEVIASFVDVFHFAVGGRLLPVGKPEDHPHPHTHLDAGRGCVNLNPVVGDVLDDASDFSPVG